MNFVELVPFARALEMRLKQNSLIILHFSDLGNPTWFERKGATNEQLLGSCDRFISFLEKNIAYLDFEALPEKEWESMRHVIDVCELYMLSVEHKDKKAKQIPEFKVRISSIRVGGTIPHEVLQDMSRDDTKFFRANQLCRRFCAIGIELKYHPEKGIEFPIEYPSQEVRFVNFQDMKRLGLSDGTLRFFCGEDWAFDVDKHLKLQKPFNVVRRGISRLGSGKSSEVEAVITRPISSDKNIIEVRINKDDPGEYIYLKREDGAWYVLELKEGTISIPLRKLIQTTVNDKYCCYRISVTRSTLDSCLEKIRMLKSTTKKSISSGRLLAILHESAGISKVPLKRVFTIRNAWKWAFIIWVLNKKDPAQVNYKTIFLPWKMAQIDFDALEKLYQQQDHSQYHETP